MDPNATLKMILDLLTRPQEDRAQLVADATEAFDNLCDWISVGGFLPADPRER